MSIIESRCCELAQVDTLKKVARELNADVYIVGGTVRDIILKNPIEDMDITLFNFDYIEFAKVLSKRLNAHHTPFKDNVSIMSKNGVHLFDISKPRGDNIYEDLLLRDFTINNLAIDMDMNLIGDDTDIRNRLIRKAYRNSLIDDPVRILRIFRFLSTLGFDIDEETLSESISNSSLLKTVPAERVLNEIVKLLNGRWFDRSITLLSENNILGYIFGDNKFNLSALPFIKENKAEIGNYTLPFTITSLIENDDIIKKIAPLKVSNKTVNDIQLFLDAKKTVMLVKTDDDFMRFVYNFYRTFHIVTLFLKANKLVVNSVENRLIEYYNLIKIENESLISGDILQERYKLLPSPLFKDILYKVKLNLVFNRVNIAKLDDFVWEVINEIR